MDQEPKFPRKIIRKHPEGFEDGDWQNVSSLYGIQSDFLCIRRVAERHGINLKKAKVLDVDSGNAKFLDYARSYGVNIVGVDVNPRGTQESPQIIARIEQLPFPDESFDIVWSSYIFDSRFYDNNPQLMKKEIMRVLKRGGLYLCNEQYDNSPDIPNLKFINCENIDGTGCVYKKL